jgi:hypothetical protein
MRLGTRRARHLKGEKEAELATQERDTRIADLRAPLHQVEEQRRALQAEFRGKRSAAEDTVKRAEGALREIVRAAEEVAKSVA